MEFYFRSTSVQGILDVGVELGVLKSVSEKDSPQVISPTDPNRDMLVVVGELSEPTGKMITGTGPMGDYSYPEMAVITDPNGVPYQHVNMRIQDDAERFGIPVPRDAEGKVLKGQWLTALAMSKMPNAVIAAALSDPAGMFVLDEDGNPRDPKQPKQVQL